MRFAAIDVGSNSLHMVVAEQRRDGALAVIDRMKEMVRLGRGAFSSGRLSADAMERATSTLATFARLLRAKRVDRVRAVATSAVREARNRGAFLERVRRETGLRLEVISGGEEAHLVFVAARHAMGSNGEPELLVDLGGGSLELILVRGGRALWTRSFKLGAARLVERFLPTDPPARADIRLLRAHLAAELDQPLARVRAAGVKRAVGTSSTVNGLVAMVQAQMGAEPAGRLHGASVEADEIARLAQRLNALPLADRALVPGIDTKRADLMPAAATLVDFVLERAQISSLAACTWALREGILLKLAGLDAAANDGSTRRRSVEAMGARFAGSNGHGRHVSRLSIRLFEALAPALGLPADSRELLEYASLLHDVGHAIDHDAHHRHSYYLIRNGDLLGFDPEEVEIIAQTAWAHRFKSARFDDPELAVLRGSKRRLVRGLAALLRLADALDRSHLAVVKNIKVTFSPGRLSIGIEARDNQADLELWTCARKTRLLEELLNRRVTVHASTR